MFEITDNDLKPYLFGPKEHEQFYADKGEIFCLRKSCEGCKFNQGQCEYKDKEMELNPNPNTRRALAVEDKEFLILKNNKPFDQISYLTYNQKMSLYESNLHWVLEPYKDFRVLKGQIRFYGTEQEFNNSKYANDFSIVKKYRPKYRIYSLDYSAIEPRLATIVTKEPEWVKVFEGESKVVAKKVELSNIEKYEDKTYLIEVESLQNLNLSDSIQKYCILEGELDKIQYNDQCAKCPYLNNCQTLESYTRVVARDWHSKNAQAFYGERFTSEKNKAKIKEMRSEAKAAGLALIYGAYIFTLARVLNCSNEKAEQLMINFFSALPVVKKFMAVHTREAIQQKATANIFKRYCNLESLVTNNNKQLLAKAKSIALNHPIQSLGADFLKLGMNKVRDRLIEKSYNILSELRLQQQIDLTQESIVSTIATVHDEVVYLVDQYKDEIIIPEIYTVMRLDEILQQFKVNFKLELDCEYDENRSWTSRKTFYASKIFLINNVLTDSTTVKKEPNTVVLDINDIDEELLTYLLNHKSDIGYKVAIKEQDTIALSFYKINDLKILQDKRYSLAYLKQ